ncbi:hypothetical protein, partial [Trinickia caryophylli]|uniref:hypothetical protein n=1 Tax=Trinickia caryophylli TaxID=28094 RepID=UPI001E5C632C
MKTFGSLALEDKQWHMKGIPPHVAIRLKQLFPRLPKWQTGTYSFPNDTTHCADISWFMIRYPLDMSEKDRALLDGGKVQFESAQAR